MRRFSTREDDGHSVVVDFFVVRPDSCGFGERLSVARNISGLRPNKANQVVERAPFVVRDMEEKGSDGLSNSCEVRIGEISDDRLKFFKGVGAL